MKFEFGEIFESGEYVAMFGNKHLTPQVLSQLYSNVNFQSIRQTHSNICVQATASVVEADAHWTSASLTGLNIKTADCIPILLYCRQTARVMAIHAGWRGVVNNIIGNSLSLLEQTGSSRHQFDIFVGPSIGLKSFEVDRDVFLKIKDSYVGQDFESHFFVLGEKYYIDLRKVAISQFFKTKDQSIKVIESSIDTKQNQNYNSFRRDKTALRNTSFIFKKP